MICRFRTLPLDRQLPCSCVVKNHRTPSRSRVLRCVWIHSRWCLRALFVGETSRWCDGVVLQVVAAANLTRPTRGAVPMAVNLRNKVEPDSFACRDVEGPVPTICVPHRLLESVPLLVVVLMMFGVTAPTALAQDWTAHPEDTTGPSASQSGLLAEPPRQETRPRDGTSRHRIGGAGRALAVFLFGRRVRGMKDGGSSQLCAHTVGRSHGNHNRRARRLSRSTVDQSRRGSQWGTQ
jgi:hypothetical protein